MRATTALLIVIFCAFGAFSSYVMLQVGYLGIWQAGLSSLGAMQVLFDLVITCLILSAWMLSDARKSGRNAWPYVAVTLFAGSFGPMLYLIVGALGARRGEPSFA